MNHCLRGEEAVRDEAFVRRILPEWGIPLTRVPVDVRAMAREQGRSVEECGQAGAAMRLFEERCAGRTSWLLRPTP